MNQWLLTEIWKTILESISFEEISAPFGTSGNVKLAFGHVGLQFRGEVWDRAIKMGVLTLYIIIWRKIEKKKIQGLKTGHANIEIWR